MIAGIVSRFEKPDVIRREILKYGLLDLVVTGGHSVQSTLAGADLRIVISACAKVDPSLDLVDSGHPTEVGVHLVTFPRGGIFSRF